MDAVVKSLPSENVTCGFSLLNQNKAGADVICGWSYFWKHVREDNNVSWGRRHEFLPRDPHFLPHRIP